MTKKETLYRELIGLRNQLYDGSYKMDIERLCKQRKYETYKIAELQRAIECAKISVAEENMKKENKKFLENTEEGRKFYKEQTDIRQKLVTKNENAYNAFDTWLSIEIQNLLGDEWGAQGSMNRVEIGLKNTDPKRNFPFMFGHSFDIRFDEYAMKLLGNYGSMGSFEISENSDRIKYLSGMSKILNNTEFIESLIKQFSKLKATINKNGKEIREIDDRINNAYIILNQLEDIS